MSINRIIVHSTDLQKLRTLIADYRRDALEDSASLRLLEKELDRATVVTPDEVPSDVVTMHSTVRVKIADNKRGMTWKIVYPHEADIDENRMSVLAPIGTALLGYRAGDEVEWQVPAGRRRFVIDKVQHERPMAGAR